MRHLKAHRKLGRKSAHRQALLRNLQEALIVNGRIYTTLAKAKALRPYAEKHITKAIKARRTLNAGKHTHLLRQLAKVIQSEMAVKLLVEFWGDECANRAGGYLRITKDRSRLGDASEMAYVEIILSPESLDKRLTGESYQDLVQRLNGMRQKNSFVAREYRRLMQTTPVPPIEGVYGSPRGCRIPFEVTIEELPPEEKSRWPIVRGKKLAVPYIISLHCVPNGILVEDLDLSAGVIPSARSRGRTFLVKITDNSPRLVLTGTFVLPGPSTSYSLELIVRDPLGEIFANSLTNVKVSAPTYLSEEKALA